MKQKELTKDIYDDFKLKKPYGLHGLYKHNYVSAGYDVNVGVILGQRRIDDNPQRRIFST